MVRTGLDVAGVATATVEEEEEELLSKLSSGRAYTCSVIRSCTNDAIFLFSSSLSGADPGRVRTLYLLEGSSRSTNPFPKPAEEHTETALVDHADAYESLGPTSTTTVDLSSSLLQPPEEKDDAGLRASGSNVSASSHASVAAFSAPSGPEAPTPTLKHVSTSTDAIASETSARALSAIEAPLAEALGRDDVR